VCRPGSERESHRPDDPTTEAVVLEEIERDDEWDDAEDPKELDDEDLENLDDDDGYESDDDDDYGGDDDE
jgi:hypothetical protein